MGHLSYYSAFASSGTFWTTHDYMSQFTEDRYFVKFNWIVRFIRQVTLI